MKAKLQTPRRLQAQDQQSRSSSSSSVTSSSSIRVTKNSRANYYYLSKNTRPNSSLKKSSRVESMLLDSQCIKIRKHFENILEDENKNTSKLDFSQIETDQLNRFISHLREYTQHCAIEGNYEDARRTQNIESQAKSVLEKRTTKIKPTIKIVEDQKESKSNFEQRWRIRFNDYENETAEKREELQRKHAHETRVFERIWAREMPQKYRKPSQRLLQLMQIEKSLAISGEIDRADYVHTQVVNQTQIEIENAQSNLIHDYQIAKSKHLEKQSIEMDRFEQLRSHGKDLLDADYRAEMLRVNHRDLVVQVQVKESIIKAKMDQTPPTRSAGVPKNRDATITSLLPRLIAPNDPHLIKTEKIRRKQIYGKQQEFQRKTIETLQAESNSKKRNNRNENVNNSFILNDAIENKKQATDINNSDTKSTEKIEKRKKNSKSSKNISDHNSGSQKNSPIQNKEKNDDYSEYSYYYSDGANDDQLNGENGMRVKKNTQEATPVYAEKPHFTSPVSSEAGIVSQNIVFESSATMFADTNPKEMCQAGSEIEKSAANTAEDSSKSRDENNNAVDENSKTSDENRKALDDSNKVVDESNKAADDKNKVVDDNNKVVDDNNKVVDDNNKDSDENSKTHDENSNTVDENSKTSDENSKALVDDNNKVVNESNKAADDKNKVVDDKNKVADDNNKDSDENSKTLDDGNKAFGESNQDDMSKNGNESENNENGEQCSANNFLSDFDVSCSQNQSNSNDGKDLSSSNIKASDGQIQNSAEEGNDHINLNHNEESNSNGNCDQVISNNNESNLASSAGARDSNNQNRVDRKEDDSVALNFNDNDMTSAGSILSNFENKSSCDEENDVSCDIAKSDQKDDEIQMGIQSIASQIAKDLLGSPQSSS